MRLIFPFEDFELTLRLDTQMVYVLPDLPRFGTSFVDLSQGQLALFRYIVDAYLSGEMVSGGDILSVVGSDQTGEARVQAVLRAERGRQLGPPDTALCRHHAHDAGRRRPYRPDRGWASISAS